MKNKSYALFGAGCTLALGLPSSAHIVSLGWESLGGGSVEFSAQHWHDNNPVDGELIFDGVSYPFTSVTWDTSIMSGLDGALINSEYAVWDAAAGTITTIKDPNWLHVTISDIGSGNHTVTAPDHSSGLTNWTLDGDIETFVFTLPTGDDIRFLNSGLRTSSIATARTMTGHAGARLARMRAGVRSQPRIVSQPVSSFSSKGGMAKGGSKEVLEPIVEYNPWEVWGQVFYVDHTRDAQSASGQVNTGGPVLLSPETETSVYGGIVGFDYDVTPNWTAGFAVSGARSDVDMTLVGSADIDTLALMPYVSYYRPLNNGSAFYADLLYAYGMSDYDTKRLGSINGDTDGEFHSLEFNTGMNFRHDRFVHGPIGQVRWLDGEIDSYTEDGLGGSSVPDSDYKSLATQLGYQVSMPMQGASGVLVPHLSAAWEHEFEDDQGNPFGSAGGETDEDLAVLGAGVGYYMTSNWNAQLNYEARVGSDTESHYVGLRVGREF